ncbi:nuclear transport factor 2 family protein [Desulfovibrio mangrovi]|uniref:nuclear transport factor 2 family protein n=1 Tax=Desulfovibrio mangrovi TaxID=2976983 RepID=UPI0022463CA2|nr:nuclear transport factor 2 family protein [Desulfovibrio mangrovi]UZP66697.1 nuclear transport factor 2 family protein [Desulfovibrio mangrovi]
MTKRFLHTALHTALAALIVPMLAMASPAIAGQKTADPNQHVAELLKSIETGAAEPASTINPEKYIQHNLGVADGIAGFGALLKALPEGSARVGTVRIFRDGDYVVAHTEYDFFGPKIGFDIFRFEQGRIVEHWDNLQEVALKTASGRTQTSGPAVVTQREKTEANKSLVKGFVNDVLMGGNPDKITEYIQPDNYAQHNPAVADGLDALMVALKSMADAGTPMMYTANHMVLGEGNFVLSVSEGQFLGNHSAFYDLFRVENGKIVEHWDTIETIPPKAEWKNANGKF